MQQEQILTGLKQQITPYQAGRLAQEIARTGIQRDRASVDAQYKGTLAEVALAKADAYIKDKSTSKEKGEALSVYRGIYGGEPGDQVDPDKLASVVQILHPNNKQNPYDLALSVLNRPGNLDPGYQTAKAEGPEAADAYVAKTADMIAKGRIKYAAAIGGTGGAAGTGRGVGKNVVPPQYPAQYGEYTKTNKVSPDGRPIYVNSAGQTFLPK